MLQSKRDLGRTMVLVLDICSGAGQRGHGEVKVLNELGTEG